MSTIYSSSPISSVSLWPVSLYHDTALTKRICTACCLPLYLSFSIVHSDPYRKDYIATVFYNLSVASVPTLPAQIPTIVSHDDCHLPEDDNHHSHRRGNLKSYNCITHLLKYL
jgi:hypothetical protein